MALLWVRMAIVKEDALWVDSKTKRSITTVRLVVASVILSQLLASPIFKYELAICNDEQHIYVSTSGLWYRILSPAFGYRFAWTNVSKYSLEPFV